MRRPPVPAAAEADAPMAATGSFRTTIGIVSSIAFPKKFTGKMPVLRF
jgi:hypothetical protein